MNNKSISIACYCPTADSDHIRLAHFYLVGLKNANPNFDVKLVTSKGSPTEFQQSNHYELIELLGDLKPRHLFKSRGEMLVSRVKQVAGRDFEFVS